MKNISLDDIKNSGKKLKVGMIILLIPIIIFTVLYLLANIYYGFFAMLFISIILILLIARGNKMVKNPEIFLETNYSRGEPKYRKNVKVESNKNIRNIPNMNWKDGKFIIDGEEFYPGYTFEDFKKTHFYNNQDGIRIIKLENMVYIEEHQYIVNLMFENFNLYMIQLYCVDDITLTSEERIEVNNKILEEYGLSEENQFEWGSIKSSYDPRSDVSSIVIIYNDYKKDKETVEFTNTSSEHMNSMNVNEICKFCNKKFEYENSANMIIICPECKKVVKIICDYGFGSILPCNILVGSKIVGTIEDGDKLISKEFGFEIKLKEGHKDLAIYNEATKIIQQYL